MQEILLKTLCNPVRLRILQCIGAKSKSVTELISTCGLSQSAVSQHLMKLKKAKLVDDTKIGREVKYSLTNRNLQKISQLLLNFTKEIEK
jgi:ArsR family transcriptional regulator